ncbi:DUF2007 domain-containing protein [Rubellicoccus peritrichatus]|uniref:DUF2007 domain-containing protein n=1 Tax=Rubellicoccus peritrichatus TaxID=3080537 RepID=A0AAQ3QX96_9BACT|nr:DUF2007 domain-containing protein [Puniceicoccus sp. CR14]WOO42797.1 DUF2007 domain-containing protein [Puniceicoccus sp. CR14]
MVTIASFSTLIEAQLKKTQLESEGISAFIPDENMIQLDWLYTNAIGGVRLQVSPEDVETAMEILNSKPVEESGGLRCPKCHSEDLVFMKMSGWSVLLYFLGTFFPIPSAKITCQSCKHVFRYDASHDQEENSLDQ